MSDYGTLQKAIIKKALLFALAAACICLGLNLKSAARGIALGGFFGIADFKLMALLVRRRLVHQSKLSTYLGKVGRLILLGIPLALAINLPSINLVAAVGGLLSVRAAVFYHFFITNRLSAADTGGKTL